VSNGNREPIKRDALKVRVIHDRALNDESADAAQEVTLGKKTIA
jgi:hypothetical protein